MVKQIAVLKDNQQIICGSFEFAVDFKEAGIMSESLIVILSRIACGQGVY